MAFIVDTYNKFDSWDRAHSVYEFEINGNWYAIKEVELEWGVPQLGFHVDQDARPNDYCIYDSYEDARMFVQKMKMIAR